MNRIGQERLMFAFISTHEKAIDSENHRILFEISNNAVDRHGEIVEVNAVKNAIPGFSRNPVCPASHLSRTENGRSPVVGNWLTDTYKAFKNHSEMVLEFEVDVVLGQEHWILYSRKRQRAVSIGFIIRNGHQETKSGNSVFVITEIELLEISCVVLGANLGSLSKIKEMKKTLEGVSSGSLALESKAIAAAVSKEVKRQITIWLEENETLIQINENLEDIKTLLIPDTDKFADSLLGEDPDTNASADEIKSEQVSALTTQINLYCLRLSFPVFKRVECESFQLAVFAIQADISSAFGKSSYTPT